MAEFKINIEQLTAAKERFAFEASAEWWAEREPETQAGTCVVERPFQFAIEASMSTDKVSIQGDLAGCVGLECSRCAKRYPHRLCDSYRLVLEPVKRRETAESDPESERSLAENGFCLGEDLEAGWYRGSLVRLEDYFGEIIALAMPLQPLCRETCLGICAHCGAERTNESGHGCECEDEKIESPFAVLARLKSVPANDE